MIKVNRVDVFQAVCINKRMYQSFNTTHFDIYLMGDDFLIKERSSDCHVFTNKTNAPCWVIDDQDFNEIFKERNAPKESSGHIQQPIQPDSASLETTIKSQSIRATEGFYRRPIKTKISGVQ